MNTMSLNLARKWRSKNFDQIIGQDLSVKMLKNSLYLGSYFPVYLFSGQRGCGKTSLARVFAAAVNCDVLATFQKKPMEQSIPCLRCRSCVAMSSGAHPDFVEIDAASHTGVDMIRQVIDASNLLPIMGVKKVYLIDEAHMLSKASFNALLKVLEEPCQSVLFILATTDPQKIIDTVRSRCFQLFFKSIDAPLLVDHLQEMCKQEQIPFERDGLQLIVDETEGSARDAINMLEQVRFAADKVNKSAVLRVLGYVSDEDVVQLLECVLYKRPSVLLQFLQDKEIERSSIEFLYNRFADLVRAAMWIKYGVVPEKFKNQREVITRLVCACSVVRLNDILDMLHSNELVFQKTTAKYSLFEMILLQICQKNNGIDDAGGAPCVAQMTSEDEHENREDVDDDGADDDVIDESDEDESDGTASWRSFITQVPSLNDPVLLSVFTQGFFIAWDDVVVQVAFSKDLVFFKDWLDKTMMHWQPLLHAAFKTAVKIEFLFTLDGKVTGAEQARVAREIRPPDESKSVAAAPRVSPKSGKPKAARASAEPTCDVSDKQIWSKTNMVLHYFPGVVTEIEKTGVHYE